MRRWSKFLKGFVMKKILMIALVLLICDSFASPAKKKKSSTQKKMEQLQPTAAEEAAIDRIYQKLAQRYQDLNVHELITEAFQEVADENREDFEIALKFSGVEDSMNPGTMVLPVGPIFFAVE